MAESLYGKNGYYTSPRPVLGRRGDFTTTPKLTKSLAKAVAAWIKQEWKEHGRKLPVIELGPGDGTLAADIFKHLGFLGRRVLNYHFVEISPHLLDRQIHAVDHNATGHHTLSQAFDAAGKDALILSNEFFDAFPVRIFKKEEEHFSELHLAGAIEHWLPAENLPDSSLFQKDWPSGQRLEVAESIQHWMNEELAQLNSGSLLTIDYGEDLDHLYHRRPRGSLRAYAHHQLLLPPEAYLNPGKQDLTFDVNFTDLSRWGNAIGITSGDLKTQETFIAGFGPGLNLDADQAFKVLRQEKFRKSV